MTISGYAEDLVDQMSCGRSSIERKLSILMFLNAV